MPSFLIRGLARHFAVSKMASGSSSSTTPNIDEVVEGAHAWNEHILWLIPFVKASGYRIVIENPKSHEKLVIDKDTKVFPYLTSEWLRRYDKQKLAEWEAKEKEKDLVRRKAEERGRKRFGNSFIIDV